MCATQTPRATPSKRLASAITATATSITLNNIDDWDGGDWTTSTFNDSTSYPVVLRNEANTQYELIEVNTKTLSGTTYDVTKRGLGYDGGTTANTETAYAWNANETIVEFGSNPPQLYEQYADKVSDETITGAWSFPTPTASSNPATKGYVDAAASSSLAYKANIISGYGSTSYSTPAIIYYSSSDQYWYPADADLTSSFQNKTLGISLSSSNTSGSAINILLNGASTSVSTSLTAGTKYYLGNSSGEIATTGTYEVYLGYALSSTEFLFTPKSDNTPTAYEKDALAGLAISTAAVPSDTNTYLTKYDTTSAITTGCLIPLRNSTGDVIVNTTPQSGDAAASRTYVDLLPDENEVPNAKISTARTHYTVQFPISTAAGWTVSSGTSQVDFVNYANYATTTAENYFTKPFGTADFNSTSVRINWNSCKGFRAKFLLNTVYSVSTSTKQEFGWGVIDASQMADLDASTGRKGCQFYFDSSSNSLQALTWVSSGRQSGTIAGFTEANLEVPNTFEIEFTTGTSVKYYVNGTLGVTHTTLPISTSTNTLLIGGAYMNNTNAVNIGLAMYPPVVSYTI